MASSIPPVARFMTPLPFSIGRLQSLLDAHHLMRDNRIRHLPVIEDGKLVGLLSLGDLHLIETFKDVDLRAVPVDEAMTRQPFAVQADTPTDAVAEQMAERKISSAVVLEGEQIVGIFTNVDGLRALVELLRSHHHPR